MDDALSLHFQQSNSSANIPWKLRQFTQKLIKEKKRFSFVRLLVLHFIKNSQKISKKL